MKKKISHMVLLLAMLSMLLGACASVPVASPEMDMKAKNMTPPPGKALLYVYRGAVFVSSAVLFKISVDGSAVGELAERTYLAVLLEPGKHLVNFGQDAPKARLPINVEADTAYYAELTVFPTVDLLMVSEDKARKAFADYKLIYESEEPVVIKSAKAKSAPVVASSSTDPAAAMKVRSDVDELPLIKAQQNRNSYAIVIGIEQYRQKLPKADFAVSDAQLMQKYLTMVLGYPEENVIMLQNDHATNVDLVKYFEKWLPNNVEKNGTVFVYFSGHGAPNPKTGDAYLVPYDGDPAFIDQTGYSLRRLYDALGKLKAKEVIVALDSCFSGAGGRSVIAKGARPLVINIHSTLVVPRNLTVISASSGDQISSTYDQKGHGLFTYFLLKGIKNEDVVNTDGSLRMEDLYGYIKPQVERIARKQYNNEQTPQLVGGK